MDISLETLISISTLWNRTTWRREEENGDKRKFCSIEAYEQSSSFASDIALHELFIQETLYNKKVKTIKKPSRHLFAGSAVLSSKSQLS